MSYPARPVEGPLERPYRLRQNLWRRTEGDLCAAAAGRSPDAEGGRAQVPGRHDVEHGRQGTEGKKIVIMPKTVWWRPSQRSVTASCVAPSAGKRDRGPRLRPLRTSRAARGGGDPDTRCGPGRSPDQTYSRISIT